MSSSLFTLNADYIQISFTVRVYESSKGHFILAAICFLSRNSGASTYSHQILAFYGYIVFGNASFFSVPRKNKLQIVNHFPHSQKRCFDAVLTPEQNKKHYSIARSSTRPPSVEFILIYYTYRKTNYLSTIV